MLSEGFEELGRLLSAREAGALAAQFEVGMPLSKALDVVHSGRRQEVRDALTTAGLTNNGSLTSCVLRSIAGAKSEQRDLVPVWTMPGSGAGIGHLTGEFHRVVRDARRSVVCATYNFQSTSQMWSVLKVAAAEPGVAVTVYVDGSTADAVAVKAQLGSATVFRSAEQSDGRSVVSHAKFVSIDHELLLLTSANFSFSAENRNVEFGLLVRDPALAGSVETTMFSKQGTLYDLV